MLVLLVALAVVLMTLPRDRQLSVSTAIRGTVLAPVMGLQGVLTGLRVSRTRVQTLRAERDTLSRRLLEVQGVEEENQRLRELLALSTRAAGLFRPANLYPAGRPGQEVKRSFVLDAGNAVGVDRDAAVVAPAGLVGIVRRATAGQATGDFWTHPDFRVSAMTPDGAVYGIIRSAGTIPPRMQLDGVPYHVELSEGTKIVTSGLGGVFPRGIPVGRVAKLLSAEVGWSRSYLVEPTVHPASVREVMVLTGHGEGVTGRSEGIGEVWDAGPLPDPTR